jgi:hypothetical protein
MSQNQATAVAPVVEAANPLKTLAIKAISRIDHFPTVQDVAETVMADGFQIPDGKGQSYVANKLVNMIEAGELDESLRAAAQENRPTIKRKPIHDKKGHVKSEDKLGRKGHRELSLGLILRNGKGFRVCGKTTKDLSEAQRDVLYHMRKDNKKSWGEISDDLKLEYNHGMTARNIYLSVEREKQAKKAKS